jgi:hypothetical protein
MTLREMRAREKAQEMVMGGYTDRVARLLMDPSADPREATAMLGEIQERIEAGELPPGSYAEFAKIIDTVQTNVARNISGHETADYVAMIDAESGSMTTQEMVAILSDPRYSREVKGRIATLLTRQRRGDPDRGSKSFTRTLETLDELVSAEAGGAGLTDPSNVRRRLEAIQQMDAWQAANPNATEMQINEHAESLLTTLYGDVYTNRNERSKALEQTNREARERERMEAGQALRDRQRAIAKAQQITSGTAVPLVTELPMSTVSPREALRVIRAPGFDRVRDGIFSGTWSSPLVTHTAAHVTNINQLVRESATLVDTDSAMSRNLGHLNTLMSRLVSRQNDMMRYNGRATAYPSLQLEPSDPLTHQILSWSDLINRDTNGRIRPVQYDQHGNPYLTEVGSQAVLTYMSNQLTNEAYRRLGELKVTTEE